MPRQRFPSDETRRRQRPHAKVHLSTRSHPRYGHVFEDLEGRAIIWGLWVLSVQYHAAQTDDTVTLGQGDLTWLTGRSQWAPAVNALRTHCERMGYALREERRRVHVGVRNLKQKQGFASALRDGATHDSAPSEEPKNQGTEEPKNQHREPRAPRSPVVIPEDALALTRRLGRVARISLPGQKVPAEGSEHERRWALEIDRLARLDGPWTWEQIRDVVDWLPDHESGDFRWGLVVRSARKLRAHFPRLHAQMTLKPAASSNPANRGYREPTPDTSGPRSAYEVQARAALARMRLRDSDPSRRYSREQVDAEIEAAGCEGAA